MLILVALSVLFTLALLQHKHLLIDWVWQPKFEWSNKHCYGHPGGICHAGKNALGTGLCLFVGMPGVTMAFALWLTFLDFVIHYHIDWSKMNLNQYWNLDATKPQFWWLTGLDQHLHQMTYLGLVWYALIVGFKGIV
ncbi:MAG: DUF3307 domain-containing protein [Verrucomicrobiaceae bacterium]|nr:MAG: DUF3307 domain-containing protein [Verrucomicrobiaceae bacterium]